MTATTDRPGLTGSWSEGYGEYIWSDPTDPDVRYRAEPDMFASIPDGDCYVPQLTVPTRDAYMVGVNHEGCDTEDILDAWERFHERAGYRGGWSDDDALDAFKRWARLFHGVNAEAFNSHGYCQGDYATIITWPSAEWRHLMGVAEDYMPDRDDVSDLEAYLWGDTWLISLETRETYVNASDPGDTHEHWVQQDYMGSVYATDITKLDPTHPW